MNSTFSWLRKQMSRWGGVMFPPDRQSMTIRHRPQSYRPWLEEFEGRVCPSVTLYTYGDQTNLAGDSVSVAVSGAVSGAASDSSGLTYSETGMPPGVSFDTTSGLFSGTINNNAASGTPYSVNVTATSSTAGSASSSFNWTVNPPVVTLYGPGDQTNLAGDTVSTSAYGSSSDGYAVTYTATGPPDLSIDSSSGIISGTIPNNAASGTPWSVTITATDASSGVSADVTLDWTVNPPVVTLYGPGDQTNLGGDTVSTSASGGSSDGYAVTYSETGLPAGLNLDTSTGDITGTITPSAWSSTPYAVTITATDASSGVSATASSDWTVNPPNITLYGPGDQTNFDGDAVSLGALYGSDSAGDTLAYSATNLPSGLAIDSSTGAITGTIGSSADTSSPYSVTVTATDSVAGMDAVVNLGWKVYANEITVATPDDQTSIGGGTATLDVTAVDDAGHALAFSATGLPLGLDIDGSTGTVSGTIAVGAEAYSPYSVTVTATDSSSGATGTASFSWNVSEVMLSQPSVQWNFVGDTISLPVTAASEYGNTLAYSVDDLPTGLAIDSGSGTISGTISPGADTSSPYSVTVTATDTTTLATGCNRSPARLHALNPM